jgi:hypothetical protein
MGVKLGLSHQGKNIDRYLIARCSRQYSDLIGRGLQEAEENVHNEKLRNLYTSPNISRMMKSMRMRWAGHVTRMEEKFIQSVVRKEIT